MTVPVSRVIDAIVGELRDQADAIATVADFGNSFEPWLKFQLARGVASRLALQPWSWAEKHGDIGVEYRYKRESPAADTRRRQKLIDLWVGFKPTVYVELKVVFCRTNQRKQLSSWLGDYLALHAILDGEQDVTGFTSVVLGVRFDDDTWANALAGIDAAGALIEDHKRVRDAAPSLHVASIRSEDR